MVRALVLLSAMLLAASPAPAAQQAALDRAVEKLFHPYSISPQRRARAVWERPIWSRETAALIARWRKVAPQDEVDDLSDGDWLCQCQDWDEHAFRLTIGSRRIDPTGGATVKVRFRLDRSDWRSARLSMHLEGGSWKIDDLVGEGFASGLKTALRRTIAEDRRR
ncbi:MAG TPA: DUF3828 domain-containing protein [Croceibacterium sp.]|jgi:hypothetical protein